MYKYIYIQTIYLLNIFMVNMYIYICNECSYRYKYMNELNKTLKTHAKPQNINQNQTYLKRVATNIDLT